MRALECVFEYVGKGKKQNKTKPLDHSHGRKAVLSPMASEAGVIGAQKEWRDQVAG